MSHSSYSISKTNHISIVLRNNINLQVILYAEIIRKTVFCYGRDMMTDIFVMDYRRKSTGIIALMFDTKKIYSQQFLTVKLRSMKASVFRDIREKYCILLRT